uniref:Uncharacterized protein n=1 Tax=Meloidogyne javanica TaxID=6303 RepID=A0A915LGK1_MELJA
MAYTRRTANFEKNESFKNSENSSTAGTSQKPMENFVNNTDCPKCHYQIHQSHPSHYVAFDRTMQDIVYKLVPGMQPVLIHLIPDAKLDPIDRSFVRLSAFATINTVKRLLAYLLFADITKYNEFDAFIRKTRWRNKPEPVVLMYKERLDF